MIMEKDRLLETTIIEDDSDISEITMKDDDLEFPDHSEKSDLEIAIWVRENLINDLKKKVRFRDNIIAFLTVFIISSAVGFGLSEVHRNERLEITPTKIKG